jgi:enoyl-CoA hydratase
MSKVYVGYVVEEPLAIVTVDHPPVNSLNRATWLRIGEIFDELAQKDITELPQFKKPDGEAYSRLCQESMNKVEFFPWPVIAAVNGVALGGGCELMMACDVRIASDKARFGLPEINLGIIPGAGGTQRMSRIVPRGYAKLLVMTGDMIPADEALRIGLVDKVVPADRLMEEAKGLAGKFVSKAPMALRLAKKAINEGVNVPLREGLSLEALYFGDLCGTEDKNEGVDAFLNKRPPRYQGK